MRLAAVAVMLDRLLSAGSSRSRACLRVAADDQGRSGLTGERREECMTTAQPDSPARRRADSDMGEGEQPQPSHSMLGMVACCVPMVLIALALLLGVFGSR